MRIKSLFALALVAIIPLSMFGCSSKRVEDNAKLTIWAYDTSAEVAEKAVELYKSEHPNVDFEVVPLGQEDMVEKIKIALSTESFDALPDIFYDEDYNFSEYVELHPDMFYDLTENLKNEEFYEYKTINVKYNNKMFAIPYDSGTGVMFYRADIIKDAGYDEDCLNNITWDEYIKIGKKVKERTGKDMIVMCPDGDMEGRLLYQSAGTWFFDENEKPNMNDPAFKDAFETIKSLYDAEIVYHASSWDDIIASISNQKIACLFGASWWAPIISEYEDQSGLWRVTNIPRMTGNDNYSNYSNLGGGNWFVLNNKNSELAAEFATEMFAQNQEIANYAAKTFWICPVNKKLVANLETTNSEFFGNQNVAEMLCDFNNNIPAVKYGLNTYEMTYTVGPMVGEYVLGKTTVDKIVDQAQKAAEKLVSNE